MSDDIQPRRDEHGVAFCTGHICPAWKGRFAYASCRHEQCNTVIRENDLCEPQARRDAAELARLRGQADENSRTHRDCMQLLCEAMPQRGVSVTSWSTLTDLIHRALDELERYRDHFKNCGDCSDCLKECEGS